MKNTSSSGSARVALVLALCVGCGGPTPAPTPDAAADATQPDAAQPDVTQPDVTQPDVTRPDVTQPDVTRTDVGVDAALDARTDVALDRVDAGAADVAATDGGFRVGEPVPETPGTRGSQAASTTATPVSECPAGQVAVGIAVSVEGRGYVDDARLECAALDATGRAFGEPAWAGGSPPSRWNTARCNPGEHLVGLLAAAGDILDRLGAVCAAPGWSASSTRSQLGPWGGMLEPVPQLCPPSTAVFRLSTGTVDYFGASTVGVVEAGCRRVSR